MAQRAGDGVLFVNAINLLKARPDGVSGEEISTVLQHSEPLLNSLKGNEFVSHDTISNIFYYKNHLTFRSEEALLATLSREPLAITPTFEEPFRAAQPLVKRLQDEGKILVITNTIGPKKEETIIYINPMANALPDFLHVPQIIKDAWESRPNLPPKTMIRWLEENGYAKCDLDSNAAHNRMAATKSARKKKSSRVRKDHLESASLSTLAFLITRNVKNIDDSGALSMNMAEAEDEEPEDDKGKLLRHDTETNPQEWELVKRTALLGTFWMYDDLIVTIMNEFLQQKLYRESELAKKLGVKEKFLGSALGKMAGHFLLQKAVWEAKGTHTTNANQHWGSQHKSFYVWFLDLNIMCDSLLYRFAATKKYLEEYARTLRDQVVRCDHCQKVWSELQVLDVLDVATGKYICSNPMCRRELVPVNNGAQIKELEAAVEIMRHNLVPMLDQLVSLSRSNHQAPVTPASSFGAKATAFARPKSASAPKKKTGPTIKTLSKVPGANNAVQLKEEDDPAVFPFNCALISYMVVYHEDGKTADLIARLPVISDENMWRRQKGHQLAKELLESMSVLEEIQEGHFCYKITKLSLFQAKQRGFRATEIVRLLEMLSMEQVPSAIFNIIMDESKYDHFFRGWIKMHNSKARTSCQCAMYGPPLTPRCLQYYLCSRELEVLRTLSRECHKSFVASSTAMQWGSGDSLYYGLEFGDTERDPSLIKEVKAKSFDLGMAVVEEYDFTQAETPALDMHIKPGIRVRDYQKIACEKIFWGPNKAHSGILVLPCGAGKTLIGINILALIKRPCVIFCQSSLAVTQWREQILNWTTVPPSKVMRFAGEFSSEWSPNPWVIISTYAMFSTDSSLYRSGQSLKWINYCKQNNWGLMILDEVHQAPAKIFKQVTAGFKTHLKLGLTATLVREDLGVQELPALVGPKLFELDIFTLRMKKHIAEVECHEIRCPMTPLCYAAHAQTADRAIQRLLYIMNLNKVRVCYNLVKFHLSHKRRIMLFCDDLFALRVYAQMLSNIIGRKVPSVDGKTENSLRESIVSNFRRAADGDVVLFSKVGDMSIDLPEADVVIQLAIIQGSRMQELQRIGRVQRPQAHKARAFFHSLVSDGTSEKGYAEHRRNYLVARGYTVDVHNDFSKFIDENTASMTDPDVENGLIASIHAEINDRVKRKDKTDDNADASEELAEVKREKRKADSITQKLEKERQKELDKMRKQAGQ